MTHRAFSMPNLPQEIPAMIKKCSIEVNCELFGHNVRLKLIRVRKKYHVRKKVFFFILVSNYCQLLEFTVVIFFVSANIITVGQCSSLTINELERSRQNQAITLALSVYGRRYHPRLR